MNRQTKNHILEPFAIISAAFARMRLPLSQLLRRARYRSKARVGSVCRPYGDTGCADVSHGGLRGERGHLTFCKMELYGESRFLSRRSACGQAWPGNGLKTGLFSAS